MRRGESSPTSSSEPSAGSLFGALYCHVEDVLKQTEIVLSSGEFREFERRYFGERKQADGLVQSGIRHFFSGLAGTLKQSMHLGKAMVTSAMVAEKDAIAVFTKIFEGITFKTLKIPFAAVSVDLVDGVPIIFAAGLEKGKPGVIGKTPEPDGLMRAVMASSAIPLIFPAVDIGGHAHTDGFIMSNLPIREARILLAGQEAFFVGFDVSGPVELSEEGLSTVELVLRLLDLSTRSKQAADKELSDVLLQPVDRSYPWSSFAEYKEFLSLGRAYMTTERLDAFETAYIERVVANARKGRNAFRRFFAGARRRRVMAQR